MTADEKNDLLEKEFHIEMEGDRKEMLSSMCNLSQGIKEQGIKQGRSFEIFSSVQEGDYGIKRGAEKMNLSIDEFKKQMASAGYEIPQSMQ